MEDALPKGWKVVKLEKIIHTISLTGKKLKQTEYQEKGILPVIDQGQSLIGGYTDEENLRVCCDLPVIIFGDHTKVLKYVNFPFVAGADGVKVIKPAEFFHSKLFYYFLKVLPLPDKGYARHFKFLKEQIVPLPPLPVQHKIVEILEEADNLRKLRKQADEKMKDLVPSLFVEMFGNPATNPKGWEIARLSNIAEFKRGPFGSSLKKEIFVKEGYKVYEQKNAIYNDFNIGNYFIDKKKYDEMIAFAVQPDDLVVSCSGTMGKIAIAPHNVKKGIINQALLKMTSDQNLVSPLVLKMLIESEAIQSKYFKNTAGSAMQNVASVKVLKHIEVSLPPLSLQQEFAERVEEIEAEKERQAESKKKLDEFFNNLMQRAFKGELVA
jgi:type I restriction enzyme S subunit